MAAEAGSLPSAQVVGNAFVQQFYHILHQSPALVYRFYQGNSKLGRPDQDGTMISVSTMEAINEKILAMDYSEFKAEIKTVDAQDSLNGGVIVLVTGYLTGKDDVKRDFTQSFFLAPQDKGYFVLNDIFRYTEKGDQQQRNLDLPNGTSLPLLPDQDSPPPQEQVVLEETSAPTVEEEEENGEEVYTPLDNEEASVAIKEEVPVEEVINEVSSVTIKEEVVANSSLATQEEAPKKSYASIVKFMKENPAPLSVPAAPARPAPSTQERHPVPAPGLAPAPEFPAASSIVSESSNIQEAEADGYSIYIKGLPLNATAAQLEDEFKKFGPIKPGGIQVRSHKLQGFCFGFVEFEVASAVQGAIEASPVMIGGRQAFVEEKRTTGSRVNNRGGRFAPGRGGGFRGDGIRGRGNYGGGRGYGRGDYSNRAEFGTRGGGRGGSSNRGADVGYQRVDQAGSAGRGSRSVSFTGTSSAPRVSSPA